MLKSFNTYIRMGHLLHFVTIIELAFALLLVYLWIGNLNEFKLSALLFLSCCPFFPQLDAWSRFQNYKLAKDQLYMFGFQERIIKPFLKSRCQRDAVMQACKELGYLKPCVNYFSKSGYRWYHLFPDVLFKDPKVVLSRNFIKTTFFAKRYKSRFDFQALQNEARDHEQIVTRLVVKKQKKITA